MLERAKSVCFDQQHTISHWFINHRLLHVKQLWYSVNETSLHVLRYEQYVFYDATKELHNIPHIFRCWVVVTNKNVPTSRDIVFTSIHQYSLVEEYYWEFSKSTKASTVLNGVLGCWISLLIAGSTTNWVQHTRYNSVLVSELLAKRHKTQTLHSGSEYSCSPKRRRLYDGITGGVKII